MRVLIKTLGCSANIAESEMISGLLQKKHVLVDDLKSADAIIVNACTVKGDQTVLKYVKSILSPDKHIVLGGCVSPSLKKSVKELLPTASFVNTHSLQLINEALETKGTEHLAPLIDSKLSLPRQRKNKIVGIIPIANGCLDHCAYCSTKLIKGKLVSYFSEEIINSVRQALAEGCKELWITAQDTSCYGKDIGTNLAELMNRIVSIGGDFKVRIGMGNPQYFKKYEIIEILKHPKVFRFLHIPLQSGSDRILDAMQRKYSVRRFIELIETIRKEIPDITLATDVIVGFPGEIEEDFNKTLEVVKQIKFDIVNLSRFVARKGTKAYSLPNQVHGSKKKDWSRELAKIWKEIALEQNKRMIGWEGIILIDDLAKEGTSLGRNYAYQLIAVHREIPIGTKVRVRIIDAKVHYLVGEIV